MHNEYGAKFTLYTYYKDGDYTIDQIPIKYKKRI